MTEIITLEDTMKILKCTEETIWFLVSQKKLKRKRTQKYPFVRYGFFRDEVERLTEGT
jgi:hypothetical protein